MDIFLYRQLPLLIGEALRENKCGVELRMLKRACRNDPQKLSCCFRFHTGTIGIGFLVGFSTKQIQLIHKYRATINHFDGCSSRDTSTCSSASCFRMSGYFHINVCLFIVLKDDVSI